MSEELTNYLHNKFKEEGKFVAKRFILKCIQEGILLQKKEELIKLIKILNTNDIFRIGEIELRITELNKELKE